LIIYYTDVHEVDEDMVTISYTSGFWSYHDQVGMMHHGLFNSPNEDHDGVASSNTKS